MSPTVAIRELSDAEKRAWKAAGWTCALCPRDPTHMAGLAYRLCEIHTDMTEENGKRQAAGLPMYSALAYEAIRTL